jgi:hypothetical protein
MGGLRPGLDKGEKKNMCLLYEMNYYSLVAQSL